jgi:hypothetical protein
MVELRQAIQSIIVGESGLPVKDPCAEQKTCVITLVFCLIETYWDSGLKLFDSRHD